MSNQIDSVPTTNIAAYRWPSVSDPQHRRDRHRCQHGEPAEVGGQQHRTTPQPVDPRARHQPEQQRAQRLERPHQRHLERRRVQRQHGHQRRREERHPGPQLADHVREPHPTEVHTYTLATAREWIIDE
jgi:hypothetical protein